MSPVDPKVPRPTRDERAVVRGGAAPLARSDLGIHPSREFRLIARSVGDAPTVATTSHVRMDATDPSMPRRLGSVAHGDVFSWLPALRVSVANGPLTVLHRNLLRARGDDHHSRHTHYLTAVK